MKILALDLATKTGWALVHAGNVTESGVWDFATARDHEGAHYGHLFQALYAKLDEYVRPDTRIAYELAHHRAGPATRIGVGLNATVLLFAARRHCQTPLCVHTGTLKRWATGDGKASKGTMMDWAARVLDRAPIDDNEADAIAVGLWAAQQCHQDALQ